MNKLLCHAITHQGSIKGEFITSSPNWVVLKKDNIYHICRIVMTIPKTAGVSARYLSNLMGKHPEMVDKIRHAVLQEMRT